mgnify:FL=1
MIQKSREFLVELKPIKVLLDNNDWVEGLILKREVANDEALYILGNIFGINLDLYYNDFDVEEDWEERDEWEQTVKEDVNNLLIGKIGYDYISEEYANCELLDDLNLEIYLSLLVYLQKIHKIDC